LGTPRHNGAFLDLEEGAADIWPEVMLCQFCKLKEATVHVTEIADNKVKKVDACAACAKEKNYNDPTAFALADHLLGLGASQKMEEASEAVGAVSCDQCGYTQADFKKSGRLGCARCYEVFSEGLDSVLKTMHKDVRHRGKVPAALQRVLESSQLLNRLSKELQDAIQREDFETAARLRDEIKAAKAVA
jgi:protein arginine kinase activator